MNVCEGVLTVIAMDAGFRLIAMSILPISKNTIVYGSNDGGHTGE